MNNYKDILTSSTTWYSLKNGLILSLGTAILTVVLAGLIAYPLSRYEMKYKKIFMLGMLFMTSLPITTVMVPVYKLFVMVKLYDNLAGVVLFMTAANLPYAIWMMKNFMDSVPISLEEAAWIDGASKLKALTKVVIPLMFAGVSSVGIICILQLLGQFPGTVPAADHQRKDAGICYTVQILRKPYHFLWFAGRILNYLCNSVHYPVCLSQKYMSKGFAMEGGAKG